MSDPTSPHTARRTGDVDHPGGPGYGPLHGRPNARQYLARVLVIIDVVGATAAALAAGAAREALSEAGVSAFELEILPTLMFVPLLVAGLAVAGCYRPAGAGLGADSFRRFARGTGFNVLIIGFVSFALRLNFSRLYVALTAVFLLVFGLGFRWILRRMAADPQLGLATRVIVAGTDEVSQHVATTLDGEGPSSFDVIGYLQTSSTPDDAVAASVVGGLDDLPQVVERLRPDAILASAESLTATELRQLYIALESIETELIVYPSLVEVASRRLDIEAAGPFPLLHLSTIRMTPGRRALKRSLDLAVASVSMLVATPLLLVAAVAIRLESPGPALFRQVRVGLEGEPFTILKLRTMVQDAEDQLADLRQHNEAGDGLFKMQDDPRITRVGRWLRRFSIDELPQLLNVLRGEMSMIGPRPALPAEVEGRDHEADLRRHRLKPGLTGFWQVSGRSDVTADEALRMDLYYVENWSLAFDLLILARTLKAVLSRAGAY